MSNTEIIESNLEYISSKIDALNNEKRFAILKILRDYHKDKDPDDENPLYAREINDKLLSEYNHDITVQGMGQHLNQLEDAGLIESVEVRKEVEHRPGLRLVNGYILREDAFENLFLEVSFLTDQVKSFMKLYEKNQEFYDVGKCIFTIFSGVDKGKTFTVNQDEEILIGRRADFSDSDFPNSILLDNSYTTVSSISKPHLKIFYDNKTKHWYCLDQESTNGTYIGNNEVTKRKPNRITNNSFIRLSEGPHSAILYCSYK